MPGNVNQTDFSNFPEDDICTGDTGNRYFTADSPGPTDILLLLECISASLVFITIDFVPSETRFAARFTPITISSLADLLEGFLSPSFLTVETLLLITSFLDARP